MSWSIRQLRAGRMAFVNFWSAPLRAEPLAAFRILSGLCLFFSVALNFLPRIADFAGPDGLCPLESAEPWFDRSKRVCLLRGPQNIPYFEALFSEQAKSIWRKWGNTPDNVRSIAYLWLTAIAAIVFGFGTRLSTFVAWVLAVSFHNRFCWVTNGGDALSRVALFFLLISPAGKVWSIDAMIRNWRRRRVGKPIEQSPPIAAWPVRLAQIQIAAVYFCTGEYKIYYGSWGADWIDGTAVYWMLNDVALTRWPFGAFPIPVWICKTMSWGTLLFEVGFPLFLLSKWTRPTLLIVGVFFHLGILLTVEVGWFSMVSLSWYPLFISGDTLQLWRRRLLRPWRHGGVQAT